MGILGEMVPKLPSISGVVVGLPGGPKAWYEGKHAKEGEWAPGSLQLELLWERLSLIWPQVGPMAPVTPVLSKDEATQVHVERYPNLPPHPPPELASASFPGFDVLALGWGGGGGPGCLAYLQPKASLFPALHGPHTIWSCHPEKTVSGSLNSPWGGSRLLVERGPTRQVLPSTSRGRRLCLATHLGPLMSAGHCQLPWQGTCLLLAPVGRIFHSVTSQGQYPGL